MSNKQGKSINKHQKTLSITLEKTMFSELTNIYNITLVIIQGREIQNRYQNSNLYTIIGCSEIYNIKQNSL